MKKRKVLAIMSILLALSCTQPVFAKAHTMDSSGGTWYQEDGKWKYRLPDGFIAYSRIITIDGYEYWFDENGFMQTGWFKHGSWDYYADENGHVLMNTMTPDGYWVDEYGQWDKSVPRWTNPNEQTQQETSAQEGSEKTTDERIKEFEDRQNSLTDDRKQRIWQDVKAKAKLQLKYKHTAKFPEWNQEDIRYFVFEDGTIMVDGWCEAKNKIGNYGEVEIHAILDANDNITSIYLTD
ncbi:hypothetical protein [Brotaphodocola sp.]|uniref:hypothetical protein n=1 Tax=Brotaphodocola sp. TaxID=3073577 RepID=UPI003D7EED55